MTAATFEEGVTLAGSAVRREGNSDDTRSQKLEISRLRDISTCDRSTTNSLRVAVMPGIANILASTHFLFFTATRKGNIFPLFSFEKFRESYSIVAIPSPLLENWQPARMTLDKVRPQPCGGFCP